MAVKSQCGNGWLLATYWADLSVSYGLLLNEYAIQFLPELTPHPILKLNYWCVQAFW